MGWRFRRIFSLGGLRWTLSPRGVGSSWGLFGIFRFGVAPDGRRHVTVRVPGTGLSWVKYYKQSGSMSSGPSSAQTLPQPSTPTQQTPSQSNPKSQPWWKQKGLGP